MKAFSIRLAGASLIALAAVGCTTTGVGTGQVVGQNVGATFTWTETGGSRISGIVQDSPPSSEIHSPPLVEPKARRSPLASMARAWRQTRS